MFKKFCMAAFCMILLTGTIQVCFAQEPGEAGGFIIEEELKAEFKTELEAEEPSPQFITADFLTAKDVEPAINFYIRSDINRKFSGLITNLKLEKIYGILQEDKIATVYFDYSYTSVRNRDNILYEKGKMTFMKFNSGKWFNSELSIYLMDFYILDFKKEQPVKEE